jgi:hypothetical protein
MVPASVASRQLRSAVNTGKQAWAWHELSKETKSFYSGVINNFIGLAANQYKKSKGVLHFHLKSVSHKRFMGGQVNSPRSTIKSQRDQHLHQRDHFIVAR